MSGSGESGATASAGGEQPAGGTAESGADDTGTQNSQPLSASFSPKKEERVHWDGNCGRENFFAIPKRFPKVIPVYDHTMSFGKNCLGVCFGKKFWGSDSGGSRSDIV